MRKRQRVFLVTVLAMVLLVAFVGTAWAQFVDVEEHWAQAAIQRWLERDLVSGYPDGTFRPDSEVTRAEFITFVDRAFELPVRQGYTGFTDVQEGDWYYGHLVAAVQAGIIGGYPDGTFQPGASISRQEAASVLQRLLGLEETQVLTFDDSDEIGSWARLAVKAVVSAGIKGGYPDGTFRPEAPITRAETLTVLDRSLPFVEPDCVIVESPEELRAAVRDVTVERICLTVEFVVEEYGALRGLFDIEEEDVVPADPAAGLFQIMRDEGITHMGIGGEVYDIREGEDRAAVSEKVSEHAHLLLDGGLEVTLTHETEGTATKIYRII